MKCNRQGRAHNTESGELVCVCPRRFESPLGVGGMNGSLSVGTELCAVPSAGGIKRSCFLWRGFLGSRGRSLSFTWDCRISKLL